MKTLPYFPLLPRLLFKGGGGILDSSTGNELGRLSCFGRVLNCVKLFGARSLFIRSGGEQERADLGEASADLHGLARDAGGFVEGPFLSVGDPEP